MTTDAQVTRLSRQLADLLAEALVEDGVSQADLARDMGLSAKHVNHMVNGKSGALGMYDFAAHVLGRHWTLTLSHIAPPSAAAEAGHKDGTASDI